MVRQKTRAYRKKFTNSDEEEMRLYFIGKIGTVHKKAIKPFGKEFWKGFAKCGKTDRTATNLCSHFRKHTLAKMEMDDDLVEKISPYKTVKHRRKFSASDETGMWKFVHDELFKNVPLRPWNPNFWKKFVTEVDSDRTPSSLCSHFRKQMLFDFKNGTLSEAQKKLVFHKLDLKNLSEKKTKREVTEKAFIEQENIGIDADEESVQNGSSEEENLIENDVNEKSPSGADVVEPVPEATAESITPNRDDLELDSNSANPVLSEKVNVDATQPLPTSDSTIEVPWENHAKEVSKESAQKNVVGPAQEVVVKEDLETRDDVRLERQAIPPRSPSPADLPYLPHSSRTAHKEPLTPEVLVKKAVRFFENLVGISRMPPRSQEERQKYAQMHNLMTNVIFGSLSPKSFDECMQKILNKSNDPTVSFLRLALPHLRDAIRKGTVFIDGISHPVGYVRGSRSNTTTGRDPRGNRAQFGRRG